MQNRWDSTDAAALGDDALAQRVYSSRLLGAEPDLVLHGGGNTSVKDRRSDFFGDETELIFVKGSGWDLATIEAPGFAPVRMAPLLKMAELAELSDTDMVREQRAAMTDPDAPTPSIEAILHAIIPGKFVDHTHADAVVALTNSPDGEQRVRDLYGERVLVVPYVMPGFILAKTVYDMTREVDWSTLDGMVLMNHGIFTWGEDAKSSYDRMIELVSQAEAAHSGVGLATGDPSEDDSDLLALASIRKAVSEQRGQAMLARWDRSAGAVGFSSLDDVADLATRGPLTPDHVIRTKRTAAILEGDDPSTGVAGFAADYQEYFGRNGGEGLTILDPSPRWAVWKGKGTLAFENSIKGAEIVADLVEHTTKGIQWGEALGGWCALPEKDIFDIEYWELEQAKLKKGGGGKPLQGKVALATGAAAGIGRACAEALYEAGAVIVALDLNPEIEEIFTGEGRMGITVNLTEDDKLQAAIAEVVRTFGGIDIVLSNAGIFTAGANIDDMDPANWDKSMAVNLTSHQRLLHYTIPFLKKGIDGNVIVIGSRNVNAPGAGAASYSCAKAGLTQLVRVASMELAPHGVRVNIIHPDAVFDTKLWTPEALARSAERYGITIEEYKTRNLLKAEIKSADVGAAALAVVCDLTKTTGAQIPVDGGNDRVI